VRARGLGRLVFVAAFALACGDREERPEPAAGAPSPAWVADTQFVRDSLGRELEIVIGRPAERVVEVVPRKGSRDPDQPDAVRSIAPRRALELMRAARPGWFVIDLRGPEAYVTEGHLPGAVLIEEHDLEPNITDLHIRVDQAILVYDEDGRSMPTTARILASYGFPVVRWLEGGFEAWREAELPIDGRS
jgi:rhodanese-related sulfurtransferase